MSIQADHKYHLVYTALSFSRNVAWLKKIQAQYGLEIPFIDHDQLAPELKEALDTYIYVPDDGDFPRKFSKMSRQYSSVSFTHLGLVPGKDILKLVGAAEDTVAKTFAVAAHYAVRQGPYRNLQVQLKEIHGETGIVEFDLLDTKRQLNIPLSSLELIAAPLNPLAGFQNLMSLEFSRSNKNAVIIDGSYALHKAIYGNDRLYTKKKRFVGGCQGFYYELLRLKELYPEYEIHVVFDGFDQRKFEDNPDYKANRAGFGARLKDAYADNLDWCERFTRALGFHLHTPPDAEGDDLIGSLAHTLTVEQGYNHVVIFSMDTDFYQLVADNIHLLIPKTSFRGNSVTITPDKAREKFAATIGGELTPINRNDKINWFRALTGDASDNIITVNVFYKNLTGVLTKYSVKDYLPIINAAETFEECRAALEADHRFSDFVESGQFDANYKLLTINRALLTGVDLDQYRGVYDDDTCLNLLQEVAFFKEIEMWRRVSRIFRAVW